MTSIPASPPPQLRMIPIAQLAAGPKWRMESMRALSEPVFLWFTAGQGRITISGTTSGFHPHNAIFLPARTMHGFDYLNRVQGTAIFMGRAHKLDLPEEPVHLRLRDAMQHQQVAQIIDAAQRELDGKRPHAERAAMLQMGLLSIWLSRQIEAQESASQSKPAAVQGRNANERLTARYTALLEREFRSGLGVTDFAAALGVTPTHLTRACRASCGRTALGLLQERRLFEARAMLNDTRVPVQDIARSLGFTTPGYFSRAFSQRTGVTPTAFRKNSTAGQAIHS